MKRFVVLLVAISVLLINTGAMFAQRVDVGIVLPTKDEPRWLQDVARFEDVISKTPYSVEVLFSQGSSAAEKTNVETLIARGAKVISSAPTTQLPQQPLWKWPSLKVSP